MSGASLDQIIDDLGELVSEVHGPRDLVVSGVAPLDRAGPGHLTFCKHSGERLAGAVSELGPCAVLCPDGDIDVAAVGETVLIVSPNPRLAFLRAIALHFPPARPAPGVHAAAVVEDGATIDPTASVGAFCSIGADVTIGPRTILYPHVTVCCPARIGADVTIRSGTVVGADGFGYERNDDGELEGFPHVGGVVIEDDVEIGANTCVDRGTLDDTLLCRGAKIDNLVHVAHNVRIGERAAVIALTMLGGSVDIGAGAWIAPATAVFNQVRVGDRSVVGLGATVVKDVADGQVVMGAPAVPQDEFRRNQKALKNLFSNPTGDVSGPA